MILEGSGRRLKNWTVVLERFYIDAKGRHSESFISCSSTSASATLWRGKLTLKCLLYHVCWPPADNNYIYIPHTTCVCVGWRQDLAHNSLLAQRKSCMRSATPPGPIGQMYHNLWLDWLMIQGLRAFMLGSLPSKPFRARNAEKSLQNCMLPQYQNSWHVCVCVRVRMCLHVCELSTCNWKCHLSNSDVKSPEGGESIKWLTPRSYTVEWTWCWLSNMQVSNTLGYYGNWFAGALTSKSTVY